MIVDFVLKHDISILGVFNPLMPLKGQEQADNFDKILQTKSIVEEIFLVELSIRTIPTTILQYFVKSF